MFEKQKKSIENFRAEFRKVTWPTKDQTVKQTGVVLTLVGILAVFLGTVDYGLSEIVKLVIR